MVSLSLDLSKAFNTVNHQILPIKINLTGRKIDFFSDSHLAPKFIKVVAN